MRQHPQPRHVAAAVCRVFPVDYGDLIGRSRTADAVAARWCYVYLCRQKTLASFPEIARAIQRQSWGGCCERYKSAAARLATDAEFARRVAEVGRVLDGTDEWSRLPNDEAMRRDPARFLADVLAEAG